jgi:hypothetical protein
LKDKFGNSYHAYETWGIGGDIPKQKNLINNMGFYKLNHSELQVKEGFILRSFKGNYLISSILNKEEYSSNPSIDDVKSYIEKWYKSTETSNIMDISIHLMINEYDASTNIFTYLFGNTEQEQENVFYLFDVIGKQDIDTLNWDLIKQSFKNKTEYLTGIFEDLEIFNKNHWVYWNRVGYSFKAKMLPYVLHKYYTLSSDINQNKDAFYAKEIVTNFFYSIKDQKLLTIIKNSLDAFGNEYFWKDPTFLNKLSIQVQQQLNELGLDEKVKNTEMFKQTYIKKNRFNIF